MNYIGSKYSLLKNIKSILESNDVPEEGIALDLFSGTGIVSQLLKSSGYIAYANDWQYYSYCITAAFILFNDFPLFKNLLKCIEGKLIRKAGTGHIKIYSLNYRNHQIQNEPFIHVLSYLQNLNGKKGRFFDSYCEGGSSGRLYFSMDNGLKIQAVRDKIEDWFKNGFIDEKEKIWLIACLLESADRAANTASVYGAYLKKIKKSAQKPLELVGIKPIGSIHKPALHKVFCEDALSLLSGLKNKNILLTYIDPPYNHRQYSANYHILETIAKWDISNFTPRGVTGLRDGRELNSDFCVRSKAGKAFDRLFSLLTSKYVIMSYNNEGLIDEKQIRGLFKKYCAGFKFKKIEYQRFRADLDHEQRNYKADKTMEYLIIGRLK